MELSDIRVLGGILTLTLALFSACIKLRNVSLRNKLAKTKRLWSLYSKNPPKSLQPLALQLAFAPTFGPLHPADIAYGLDRADPLAFFECRRLAKKWVRLKHDGSGFEDVRAPGWRRPSLTEMGRALNFAASPALFIILCIAVLVWDEGLAMQVMVVIDALGLLIGFSAMSVQLQAAGRLVDSSQFPPSKPMPANASGALPKPEPSSERCPPALASETRRISVKKFRNGTISPPRPH